MWEANRPAPELGPPAVQRAGGQFQIVKRVCAGPWGLDVKDDRYRERDKTWPLAVCFWLMVLAGMTILSLR